MGLHRHTHDMTRRCVAIVGFEALFFCKIVARWVYPEHGIPDFISFMRARNPVFGPKMGIKIGDSVLWSKSVGDSFKKMRQKMTVRVYGSTGVCSPPVGIEPTTTRLKAVRSTCWAREAYTFQMGPFHTLDCNGEWRVRSPRWLLGLVKVWQTKKWPFDRCVLASRGDRTHDQTVKSRAIYLLS